MYTMIPYRSTMMNRYNPFNDDFFRGFFAPMGEGGMRVDVQDAGDKYLLNADMPGFSKDNIHVELEDNVLTISANVDENHEEKDEKGYVLRERRVGSVKRSFSVEGIDKDAIAASYEDGVLHVTLPKEQANPAETKRLINVA